MLYYTSTNTMQQNLIKDALRKRRYTLSCINSDKFDDVYVNYIVTKLQSICYRTLLVY